MIIASITLTQFIVIAFIGMIALVAVGMLVIIKQYRNKPGRDFFKRHGID